MTELEIAKLRIEHLEDKIFELELRLKNAFTFIEYCLEGKKETEECNTSCLQRSQISEPLKPTG